MSEKLESIICVVGSILIACLVGVMIFFVSQKAPGIVSEDSENKQAIIELPDGEIIKGDVSYIKRYNYRIKVTINNITYDVANDNITIISEES